MMWVTESVSQHDTLHSAAKKHARRVALICQALPRAAVPVLAN